MSLRRITARKIPAPLQAGMAELAGELEIPEEFPADVLQEADEVARSGPIDGHDRVDRTDIEFCTIDPASSTDLDQALHIERRGTGYRVHYAIADVAAWVKPGGAIDTEARRRGTTLYAPTWRVPLHPSALSEDAASLLADGKKRPALLWTIDLDSDGVTADWNLERAWVLNREKLSYEGVQRDLEAGRANPSCQLLAELGRKRIDVEARRGGVSLNLPEQQVVDAAGTWSLEFRDPAPVEDWNAQISLLTGMCAAQTMLHAGIGILRTMPPADPRDIKRLRATAASLNVAWPSEWNYPQFVRSLDPSKPSHLAMMNACAGLFRGASYTVIGADRLPEAIRHAALAAPYAHTTAPLRRLVDRFTAEACVDILAGEPVADWVVNSLDELPELMSQADRRSRRFEKGIVSLTEALVLREFEGQTLAAAVVDIDDRRQDRAYISIPEAGAEVAINQPAMKPGATITVRVVKADPASGDIKLKVVPS